FRSFQGLQLEDNVTVLTTTTGLLDEFTFDFVASLADGFAVSHLWFTHVGFHAEFTAHAVYQNFQVQLAHTGNNGLAGFFVAADAERRIFLSQTGQGDRKSTRLNSSHVKISYAV